MSGGWGNRSAFPAGLVVPVLLAFAFFVLVPCAILLVKGLEPAAETGSWPDFRTSASVLRILWENRMGAGINSGVSRQA